MISNIFLYLKSITEFFFVVLELKEQEENSEKMEVTRERGEEERKRDEWGYIHIAKASKNGRNNEEISSERERLIYYLILVLLLLFLRILER